MSGTATAERHDAETIEGLFQPDILAPAQYFEGLRKEQARAPERDLALALLEDAVVCFQKYLKSTGDKERRIFTDADEWCSSDDRGWVFSFLNVCDFLGLDPGFLRKGLLRWKEAALSGRDAASLKWTEATADEMDIHGGPTEGSGRRHRRAADRQPERFRRRRARSARGRGLALVRKARGRKRERVSQGRGPSAKSRVPAQ